MKAIGKVIADLTPLLIIIAMFAYTFSVTFNLIKIPYLYQQTTDLGQTYWKYDFASYLRNLNTSLTSINNLNIELPEGQWQNITDFSAIDPRFWGALLDNLKLIANWAFMPVNLILWILRFISYLLINIFSILGFPKDTFTYINPLNEQITIQPAWFMETLKWIIDNLKIPFLQ